MFIFRFLISPHFEHLYFYCLINWVIEITGELDQHKGKRRPIGWNTSNFHFSYSNCWLVYPFEIYADFCLTNQLVVIIWAHIWQGLLVYWFLSSSDPIKHRPYWTISGVSPHLFWQYFTYGKFISYTIIGVLCLCMIVVIVRIFWNPWQNTIYLIGC